MTVTPDTTTKKDPHIRGTLCTKKIGIAVGVVRPIDPIKPHQETASVQTPANKLFTELTESTLLKYPKKRLAAALQSNAKLKKIQ